jgi:hypothetical protein
VLKVKRKFWKVEFYVRLEKNGYDNAESRWWKGAGGEDLRVEIKFEKGMVS